MSGLKDDRYFDADVETMSREQIEQLQEARILQLVPYAYQRSPLVRAVWEEAGVTPADIRSLADFKAKAPFIDKDTIRQFRDRHGDPFGGLACATAPHLRGVGFTSGTTGDPTPLPRAEEHITLTALKRELWHIGVRSGDYFSYALFTFREGLNSDKWLDSGFRPVTLQHLPSEVPHLIEISRRLRPKALFMISTPLIMAIDQYQKNTGTDLREAFSSYRGAVFGGEPMSPALRSLVQSWGLEIFELTSLGDISTAMECRAHDGMHAWEDLALVEHLDPDGDQEAADGTRGELVVTALADDVAPLIRFRTDDLVSLTRETCSCGRTHCRMKLLGRKSDELIVHGRSVMPLDLFPLLQQFPETQAGLFQIVKAQREAEQLRLRVGYDASALATSEAELSERIVGGLAAALDIPVRVELLRSEELTKSGHKIPRVIKP
ncbi:phenylacetate--CoA ligase family protein [Pseudomonas lopnurensis]|uniref:phenylacetate--CoA ligase family protein n=1 Tax=Pseudomonas lopnurensis TaxID=1477517 RepID=UPI0028A62C78|nr:phenylacetate--CoA ligase family protein [Pseudomonas lopnurensis]